MFKIVSYRTDLQPLVMNCLLTILKVSPFGVNPRVLTTNRAKIIHQNLIEGLPYCEQLGSVHRCWKIYTPPILLEVGGRDKMSADVTCRGSCEKRTRKKGQLSMKTEGGTKIKGK
jgi:hypothetical protein